MFNLFILIAILFANAVAILLIYQFIKKLPQMEKIIFIAACFAISYVSILIIYMICGTSVNKEIHTELKDYITFIFVPVNIILLAPFVASKYYKLRQKEVEKKDFIKRLIIIAVIAVMVLVTECIYFINIINDIEYSRTRQQEIQQQVELDKDKPSMNKDIEVNEIIETNTIDSDDTVDINSNIVTNTVE